MRLPRWFLVTGETSEKTSHLGAYWLLLVELFAAIGSENWFYC